MLSGGSALVFLQGNERNGKFLVPMRFPVIVFANGVSVAVQGNYRVFDRIVGDEHDNISIFKFLFHITG
jgi:hypothetical protein